MTPAGPDYPKCLVLTVAALATVLAAIQLAAGAASRTRAALIVHGALHEAPPALRVERSAISALPQEATRGSRSSQTEERDLAPGMSELVVRVHAGGRPVERAVIQLDEGRSGDAPEGRAEGGTGTDARGLATLLVPPMRTLVLSVTAPASERVLQHKFTSPRAGRTRRLEIDLCGGLDAATARIAVACEVGGTPLARAGIELEGFGAEFSVRLQADERGQVLVPRGPDLAYRITAPGYVGRRIRARDLKGLGPWNVALRPTARVHGTLALPPDGEHRGTVALLPLDEPAGDAAGPDWQRFAQARWRAEVAPDGSWSIDGIAIPHDRGRLIESAVEVFVAGSARRLALLRDVRPGSATRVHDPWIDAAPLEITLVGPDAQPVPAARLTLRSLDGDGPIAGRVSPDGRSTLAAVPTGSWELELPVPGVSSAASLGTRFERLGADRLTLALPPARSVEVLLRGAPDRARPRVAIALLTSAEAMASEHLYVVHGKSATLSPVDASADLRLVAGWIQAIEVPAQRVEAGRTTDFQEFARVDVPAGSEVARIDLDLSRVPSWVPPALKSGYSAAKAARTSSGAPEQGSPRTEW